MIKLLYSLLKWCIKWGFILICPILIPCILFYLYYYIICGKRPIKGSRRNVGYGNFFKKLFIDFPRRLVLDKFNYDPDTFEEYGLHIFSGMQGCGKTVTMIYVLRRLQQMYPKLKVKTNIRYDFQDDKIKHWKDIVSSENGIYGEVDAIDELQNWFNSMQSKDFPPEMLTEITQQRKQRKCIFGTSQVFTRLAKPLREQTTYLYLPVTIGKCLTIVRKYRPIFDDRGNVIEKKLKQVFFFVQDEELRTIYDTYEKVKDLIESGFKDEEHHLRNLREKW